jgi:N-methylhydantoinase A/oxoprolinase/acetone carboxylase beta subunit
VYWYDRAEYVDTPVYLGAGVAPGTVISGPAIVDYDQTTVVVREQQRLTVDPAGNLVIRWQLDPMEESH